MKTYLLNLWDRLRASFWFLPAVLGGVAILTGIGLPLLDQRTSSLVVEHLPALQTTTAAARSTLSAIAGANVTVAGTVFSITIVILSLTSQQFGPRLLRTFMYDMTTQWTLGVFLSTSLYCLLVLRGVANYGEAYTAPHLSVLLAMVLAVVSVGYLIYFVHHVSVMIQASHIVKAVAEDLDGAIVRLFPETLNDPPSADQLLLPDAMSQADDLGPPASEVLCWHEGYVQAMDLPGILALAQRDNLVIGLRYRPGHFVHRDATLADIWSKEPIADDDRKRITETLNDAVIVGMRRTPRQDAECAINELVEVAVRSLSPGINDPFTAMDCIDRLSAALARLTQRQMPARYLCDSDDRLRVIAASATRFPDILAAALNQIRQNSRGVAAVTIRLLEALRTVAAVATRSDDRDAIRQHAEMIVRSGRESLPEEADRQQVEDRYTAVIAALES